VIETILNPVLLAVGTAIGGVIASSISALSYGRNSSHRLDYSERVLTLLEKIQKITGEDPSSQKEIDVIVFGVNKSILEALQRDLDEFNVEDHSRRSNWSVHLLLRTTVRSRLLRILQFLYFLLVSFVVYIIAFRLSGDGFVKGDLMAVATSLVAIAAILIFSNWYQGILRGRSKQSAQATE